jgi:hypothetical protein
MPLSDLTLRSMAQPCVSKGEVGLTGRHMVRDAVLRTAPHHEAEVA